MRREGYHTCYKAWLTGRTMSASVEATQDLAACRPQLQNLSALGVEKSAPAYGRMC